MTHRHTPGPLLNRKAFLLTGLLGTIAATAPRRASAVRRVRYALPAPAFLPAFTPINVAVIKGATTREENLDVEFQTVAGGTEVAKRVASR